MSLREGDGRRFGARHRGLRMGAGGSERSALERGGRLEGSSQFRSVAERVGRPMRAGDGSWVAQGSEFDFSSRHERHDERERERRVHWGDHEPRDGRRQQQWFDHQEPERDERYHDRDERFHDREYRGRDAQHERERDSYYGRGREQDVRYERERDQDARYGRDSQEQRGTGKYTRAVKASGTPIRAGAAIMEKSLPKVVEETLIKNFNPPKKQDSFLGGILQKSNEAKKRSAKPAVSFSLEAASAPSPPFTLRRQSPHEAPSSTQPIGTSGWTKKQRDIELQQQKTKPRISLADVSSLRSHSPSEGRPRRSSGVFTSAMPSTGQASEQVPTNRQMALRVNSSNTGRRLKTRATTKRDISGSADQPIALDDSDSEEEEKRDKTPPCATEDQPMIDADQSDSSSVDIAEIRATSLTKGTCDVLFGLFQCTAKLIFQNDRVYITNISGCHEKWPFQSVYELRFDMLNEASVFLGLDSDSDDVTSDYDHSQEEAPSFIPVEEHAPFLAVRCPCLDPGKESSWQSFFDPVDSGISKRFIVFKPGDIDSENDKVTVNEMVDIIRSFHNVERITMPDSRKYLEALDGDPYSYTKATRRRPSNRKRKKPGDEESDEDNDANEKMLTYPLPPCTTDIVTLIRRDVSRLKPERYLNDNLIDYYFKRLMQDTFRDDQVLQQRVLFLSSHFYSLYRVGRGSNKKDRLANGYKNVSKWLARADFFNRSMIFIPINKDLHWSLAMILNPKCAAMGETKNDDGGGHEDAPRSCIAVLDPLGSYHNRAVIVRSLRTFLRLEWENSRVSSGSDEAPGVSDASKPAYDEERVESVMVKAPRQENGYDCGVYVLKYAEELLRNAQRMGLFERGAEGVVGGRLVAQKLEPLLPVDAFDQEDVDRARGDVRRCIESDIRRFRSLARVPTAEAPAPAPPAPVPIEAALGSQEEGTVSMLGTSDDDGGQVAEI